MYYSDGPQVLQFLNFLSMEREINGPNFRIRSHFIDQTSLYIINLIICILLRQLIFITDINNLIPPMIISIAK